MNGARPFSHEVGTWTQGYEAGVRRARRDARVEAFAAIRRAAAVARGLDDRSAETFAYGNKVQAIADGMSSHNIRRAIRAAIGSEKA